MEDRQPSLGPEDERIDVLERLLAAVERGDLTADGPAASALVRRLEGALIALRVQIGDLEQDPTGEQV